MAINVICVQEKSGPLPTSLSSKQSFKTDTQVKSDSYIPQAWHWSIGESQQSY